jgi:acid phosphatase type 7
LLLALAVVAAPGVSPAAAQSPPAPDDVVFVGAGDIARCDLIGGARATAALLDSIPGTVFTLGDNAYEKGTAAEFQECYEPTWGRHKGRTRPTTGNHDYLTDRARPYFKYFGDAAGPDERGYYSFDLGAWHIISLNSSVPGALRAQTRWLREDLASHPSDCLLAYWHEPVYSSGPHTPEKSMQETWSILYKAGADIVMNGHDHLYERFAPQDDRGKADAGGIRQFIVGTGGGGVYTFGRISPNSEVRDNSTYGVLKLTLSPGHYAWEFIAMPGSTFKDAGTGTCSPRRENHP